jgi:hypothetical protein
MEAPTLIHSPRLEMNRIEELFGYGGWFDRVLGRQPGERLLTWRAALSVFVQRNGSLIVETGCQRQIDDAGDGLSTRILALLLNELNRGILHSVDISAESLTSAKTAVSRHQAKGAPRFHLVDRVRFHLSDSVEFLRKFDRSIDFLYLDSCDYFEDEPRLSICQIHQLKEIEAAFDKLSPGAVVLLDDNALPFGGKTRLSKKFLSDRGWYCLLDWAQSLWIRSITA